MLNYIIMGIIGIIAIVGNYLPNNSIWDKASNLLGTTSFPTSLDTLTNPGATDSVATVSHSSQHANANDAIEAIEAKIGTGASTATNGTVLFGNGVGTSAWSATPSLTSLSLSSYLKATGGVYASSTGVFDGGILSIASSTFNAPFRFPSISQGGLYTGTGGLVGSFATTTATCTGGATCSTFGVIGSTPIVINIPSTGISVSTTTPTIDSSHSDYRGVKISTSPGDIIIWWVTADHGGSPATSIDMVYRWNTDTATSTIMIDTTNAFTGHWSLQASTTNSVNIGFNLGGNTGTSLLTAIKISP